MNSASDRVTAYALGVDQGRIIAGPHVRGACARHLGDMKRGAKRGLFWDVAKANRAIGFFETVLRLNGGQHEGLPFILLDWQAFIVGSLFGWVNRQGLRRYRTAYVETGKGSGKSPLAGGIGLYMLVADNEPRAEVYAAASKKDQAMVLYRDAVAMVRQSPKLARRLQFSGGEAREYNMALFPQPKPGQDPGTVASGFFRPISSDDGQSGPRPHCSLVDELHEHRTPTMVDLLSAGVKFRRQPLDFYITNSGSNRTSVCYEYHQRAAAVCRGDREDDTFFAYVCALDEGEDPLKDEACWPKANPSLGHTFSLQYLRDQVTKARGMPSKEGVVKRLNFCMWTEAATEWIDRDLWDACEADFDPDELRGLPCYLGLDLASKRDLTALAACWMHPDGTFSACCWFWTPGDTLEERANTDHVPYLTWRDQEHLFAPEGRIVDKGHVAQFAAEFCSQHEVKAIAYDQAQADEFVKACDYVGFDVWIWQGADKHPGVGVPLIRHGQGFAGYASQTSLWMPRSISTLESRVVERKVRIRRSPVLRWNSASAVLVSDPTGNRKWDKQKSTGRIDGMVALSQAVGAAEVNWIDAGTHVPQLIAI